MDLGENLKASILIENHLPTEFYFDVVSLELNAGEGKDMIMQANSVKLEPGMNQLHLSCARSAISGDFSPSSFVMKKGKLTFDFEISQKFQKKAAIKVDETELSLKFHAEALLDKETRLMIRIDTNSVALKSGTLGITSLSSIKLLLPDEKISATLQNKVEFLNLSGELISLPALEPYSSLAFFIQYSNAEIGSVHHKVKFSLMDIAASGGKFFYSAVVEFSLAPLLTAEQVVSYTPLYTFLKYRISTVNARWIRIISYEIQPNEAVSSTPHENHFLFCNSRFS